MKEDWYNKEGYFDPTCGEAMERAERERRRKAAEERLIRVPARGRKLDKKRGGAYTGHRL